MHTDFLLRFAQLYELGHLKLSTPIDAYLKGYFEDQLKRTLALQSSSHPDRQLKLLNEHFQLVQRLPKSSIPYLLTTLRSCHSTIVVPYDQYMRLYLSQKLPLTFQTWSLLVEDRRLLQLDWQLQRSVVDSLCMSLLSSNVKRDGVFNDACVVLERWVTQVPMQSYFTMKHCVELFEFVNSRQTVLNKMDRKKLLQRYVQVGGERAFFIINLRIFPNCSSLQLLKDNDIIWKFLRMDSWNGFAATFEKELDDEGTVFFLNPPSLL
jgi:hypothetical protein